ncbi:MAG TPA: sulfurtransferase-like selenium metabolism protein YedF [Firmicutes bacterium]|jgi:selenium metabolism protein YedF|nr:sulfurtransferase-like selenium metabolism protein YedF [Bacillota bacterium]HAA38441.1 sulfurtransferase-like selenium metabolism protein YedF [Bacillota bacterium]
MRHDKLDCRGLACPQPVVETKKKLSELSAGTLTVLVDNETAKNNLLKLANSLGLTAASKKEADDYSVTIMKEAEASSAAAAAGKVILVAGETLGHGSDELGTILMKSFFYALAESTQLPQAIYFLNGGVKLACTGSPVLESLCKLQSLGVEIYACGLCLDFFQLTAQLAVGEVTNMYAIVEQITAASVIKL